eukprot:1646869-Karenia_brevis.AAC.1
MRNLEIRDLWLQKEVSDVLLEVSKIPGEDDPADLPTKILGITDIVHRLIMMSIYAMGLALK